MNPAMMLLAGLLLGQTPGAGVKSGDWPEWRGPNRDGICLEKGLLDAWPEGGPKLLWDARSVNGKGVPNVGVGYSSLSIANGKIYTLGVREKNGCVICLDLKTGKVLWHTPFSPPYGDGGTRGTPTVTGNRVYGMSPQGNLVCVDANTGEKIWAKDLKNDFGGRMMSGWNYSESPLIDGDKLIVVPGGKKAMMVALKKETGETIWSCAAPKDAGAGYSSVIVTEAAGVRQYLSVVGPQLGLIGVDAKTGKFLWNYAKVANGTANIPTPIIQGDTVFASTAYGTGAALLQLTASGDGSVNASEVYFLKANTLQNHHGGMVRIGDYVYGGHGHNNGLPFCLEWKTGKLAWGPERGAGSGSAAVLYADGHLYFRYQDNTMALIEATPKGYNLKSSFRLPNGTSSPGWQHLVIHDGRLYVRANDQLYCYDIRK